MKRHLHKLEELEYLIVHHGSRGQTLVYELYFERPADPEPAVPSRPDRYRKAPIHDYDGNLDGPKREKVGPSMPQVRPMDGGGTVAPELIKTGTRNGFHRISPKNTDTGGAVKIQPVVVAGVS